MYHTLHDSEVLTQSLIIIVWRILL